MTRPVMTRAIAALLLALALDATAGIRPGLAQVARAEPVAQVVVVRPVGVTEAALSSCAGGAMIGYLLVLATGGGAPTSTAVLFCGLSAAASVTSSLTMVTWQTVNGWFAR